MQSKEVKRGICASHHFAVTHGGEVLYLWIFFFFSFLWLGKQLLAECDAFFVWTYITSAGLCYRVHCIRFTPFCCHTWRGGIVPLDFFFFSFLWLGKQLLAECDAFFVWTYITSAGLCYRVHCIRGDGNLHCLPWNNPEVQSHTGLAFLRVCTS